jgi:hypothetical protein
MSTSALNSQGMDIAYLDVSGSPEVYTSIPEVNTLAGPDGSASEIDVTDLASTAKEFLMGLKDSGSVTMEILYIPANVVHTALRANWDARTLTGFQITFTDSPATLWTFNAYVQNFAISAGVDAALTGSITLRITGDITES